MAARAHTSQGTFVSMIELGNLVLMPFKIIQKPLNVLLCCSSLHFNDLICRILCKLKS